MAGGALTGPCSLCGAKSSVGWRRLPECARDKAGDPACNACFVSVWKCHREDPGSMDAMLATRAALQTAPRPKRRRRGMKLVRSRPKTSKAAGKKREHIGSTPRRQSSQSSDSDQESSQRNATGSKSSGSSSTEQEEAKKQHGKERQHQEAEQQQREQSPPHRQQSPPPPLPHQQQLPLLPQPPPQSPNVASALQMLQRQQEQACPGSPLPVSTQRYQLSPLHSMPLPPPPPLPRAQQQQQQQPSLAPPAAGLVQPPLHVAPLPPPPLLPFQQQQQQQQQQPPPAAPQSAAQQQLQLLPHATGLPPPPQLQQLLPHVLLPQQPQLLPLPQPLSMVVGAPQPLWAARLSETPGLPPALAPGFQAASLQQLVVDMRSSSSQEAASRAWLAACELPGARPQLLGLLPAMWVQAAGGPVQLAGVLLVHVLLPPPGLSFEAQQALLVTGQGLQPELRLVVYCFQTGRLLHRQERLGQEECLLQLNPCHNMQAWDSRRVRQVEPLLPSPAPSAVTRLLRSGCREGWQLLFPEAGARKQQVTLFVNLVLRFGRPLRPDQIPGGPKAAAAATAAVQQPQQQPPPQQQQPASFPASHRGQPPAAAAAAAAGQRFPSSGHWCSGLPDSLSHAPLLLEVARGAAGITDDELRFLCTILDTSPDDGGSGGGHAG